MNNKPCSRRNRSLNGTSLLGLLLLVAGWLSGISCARAGVPDWLREAARAPLPKYPDDLDAVLLLDEQVTTINQNGEIKTRYRVGYKILRPEGRERGTVVVYFDNETRLTYLKAWTIPSGGHEYEVKEKEAVEASFPGGGILYQDTHFKILTIPAAEPGNVIGYEYEQKRRPYVLQDIWRFQDDIPVRRARFELNLPEGWEFDSFWLNHPVEKPRSMGGNQWVWELSDLPAVESQPAMPAWRAVAGRMAVTYFSRRGDAKGSRQASWAEIGRWYNQLADGRRQMTPEIEQKVKEVTATAQTPLEKIAALGAFAQRDIRYVAIEIGIGGFQPHAAQDIFANRYGDCKDKATLLSAMLHASGIESYYVLVNTSRGVVERDFPTALTFNHAILAIRLPEDVPTTTLYAVSEDSKLGRLLFFDPTDPLTKLGYLPATEQKNYGLVVTEGGGELVEMPLLPPTLNRLIRSAKLQLSPTGDLSGDVEEIRWGVPDVARRAQLLAAPETEQQKTLENFLGNFLGSLVLQGSRVGNLENYSQNLILDYRFLAKDYAKRAGNLLLIRPRVLGEKALDLNDSKEKERKYPVEFYSTSLDTDMFDIVLPPGYEVEELPPPVEIKSPFGEYRSKVDVAGNVLHYRRNFEIRSVLVPTSRVDELKAFFRQIDADERASAVLKQRAAQPPGDSPPAPHPAHGLLRQRGERGSNYLCHL